MDELLYSVSQQPQEKGQFEYPTPSQEDTNMEYYAWQQNSNQYSDKERHDKPKPSRRGCHTINFALMAKIQVSMHRPKTIQYPYETTTYEYNQSPKQFSIWTQLNAPKTRKHNTVHIPEYKRLLPRV
jgi:hypothetical protein